MADNNDFVRKVLPVLIGWGVTKVLELPQLARPIDKANLHVDQHRQRATAAAQKATKQAVRNAVENGVWLAAGVIVVAAGVALIVKAARR